MAVNDEMSLEDRVVLELLDARGLEDLATVDHELPSRSPELERFYLELLGLLPDELEPETPSEGAKRRLMAAVAEVEVAGSTAPGEPGEQRGSVPEQRAVSGLWTAPAPVAANENRLRSFLVAAVITLMMVGVAGWFYVQLDRQRGMVAQLQDELRATNLRLEELNDGRRDVVASLRDVGMMESIPVEWCPLRPAGENPVQPDAHGSLLLVREHGRWSVRLHNLAAATGDQVYVLWFLDENRPLKKVNLGRGDRPVRIAATGVSELMTAAAVTLEASLDASEPTGPRILYGHSREMDRL